jgi:transcriptional regulator with XRE-family HTH domain
MFLWIAADHADSWKFVGLAYFQLKEYDRLMLRSSFVSLFWSVIADLKKRRGYRLQELADQIGVDKSGVSRWFSGNNPNWTLNTVSDLANALNVDLRVQAVDRETQAVHTPQGKHVSFRLDPSDNFETLDEKPTIDFQPLKPHVHIYRSPTEQLPYAA